MTKYILILILPIFFFSCNNQEPKNIEKNEREINKKEIVISNKIDSLKQDNLPLKIDKFLKLMYDTNYTVVNLFPKSQYTSRYIENFSFIGLNTVKGYGNKKILKYKNIYYTNFDVYVFEYYSENTAKQAFDTLKVLVDTLISHSARRSFNWNDDKYKVLRHLRPKHGGFIFREKNYIISLVKRCNGNHLQNVDWVTYENTFLETLNIDKNNLEVIWARCGSAMFILKEY